MEYKLSESTFGLEEKSAIFKVVSSKQYTMGTEVAMFEKEFAEKMGVQYAVMSNSGSSANLLAIAALIYSNMLKRGDEVIVPAVSWSTTYFPLHQYGLKLRFVDIDKETFNIDVNQIENAITDKTKAIFAVDLLGNPNDYDSILDICARHNLILIEDCCEAMGGKYKDQYLGTFGTLGTYSMYFSHHLCSIEGGITVTDDENLYHYILSLRSHGWTRSLPEDSNLYTKHQNPFYEKFNFILPGYNLRPTDIQGAIAREQLLKLDEFISDRRANADFFRFLMDNSTKMHYQKEIEISSWFGFGIIIKDTRLRDLAIKILTEEKIETRPIVAGNFTRNPVIDYMDYSIHGNLTNADLLHDNGFFIGNHSKDITDNILRAVTLIMGVVYNG